MHFNVLTAGLFDQAELKSWIAGKQRALRAGTEQGMKNAGPKVRDALRVHLKTVLKVRKASFEKVMTFRVYAKRLDRMPSMAVGALRAQWLDIQAGGVITPAHGKRGLLIPFGNRRIGKKIFARTIAELMRSHNAYFRRVNGTPILFAERLYGRDNNRKTLRRFLGGVERGEVDIPIAVLVPQVRLAPRLRVAKVVQGQVPVVAREIERALRLDVDITRV